MFGDVLQRDHCSGKAEARQNRNRRPAARSGNPVEPSNRASAAHQRSHGRQQPTLAGATNPGRIRPAGREQERRADVSVPFEVSVRQGARVAIYGARLATFAQAVRRLPAAALPGGIEHHARTMAYGVEGSTKRDRRPLITNNEWMRHTFICRGDRTGPRLSAGVGRGP